jgi:hypothetical protein
VSFLAASAAAAAASAAAFSYAAFASAAALAAASSAAFFAAAAAISLARIEESGSSVGIFGMYLDFKPAYYLFYVKLGLTFMAYEVPSNRAKTK